MTLQDFCTMNITEINFLPTHNILYHTNKNRNVMLGDIDVDTLRIYSAYVIYSKH